MKKWLSLLMAGLMILALAACGKTKDEEDKEIKDDDDSTVAAASDFEHIKEKGKLTIGYTVYEPMSYTDESGNFTGFDTELAKIVCEKLGVEASFVEIHWDTKEVELKAKSIDCIWNGLTIDEERKANMEITQPYVKNAQVVVMKVNSAYKDTSSVVGKTVLAEIGSAGETAIKEDENLSKSDYVGKKVQTDCLMEIKAGTAEAAVLDLTLANTMTGEGTGYSDLKMVDRLVEENYGVAFRKGSDICEKVNQVFDELVADGTMAELAEKYGLELTS